MKSTRFPSRRTAAGIILAAFLAAGFLQAQEIPRPPAAEKIRKELAIHGQTRVDEYYWLNERANPKVVECTSREAYAEAVLKPTESLQEKLVAEMNG